MVCIDNRFLKLGSEIRIDRMHDVAVRAVGIFSRGHNDEISISCIDYLDVVDGEAVVEGYGHDRLHRTFLKEFSDFDVCDLHLFFSFRLMHSLYAERCENDY